MFNLRKLMEATVEQKKLGTLIITLIVYGSVQKRIFIPVFGAIFFCIDEKKLFEHNYNRKTELQWPQLRFCPSIAPIFKIEGGGVKIFLINE